MKTALIFLHGDLSDISYLPGSARKADLIIAADGGAQYAVNAGLTPHIIIGDFDSISETTIKQLQQKSTWKKYPRHKDYTDSELAFHHALSEKCLKIYVVGFLGRRLDHMLANIYHLSTLPAEIILIEGDQHIFFIKEETEIEGKKGDEISLIPLHSDCHGITTLGLSYPLTHEILPYGTTRGISNVLIDKKATVSISEGILICIHRSL